MKNYIILLLLIVCCSEEKQTGLNLADISIHEDYPFPTQYDLKNKVRNGELAFILPQSLNNFIRPLVELDHADNDLYRLIIFSPYVSKQNETIIMHLQLNRSTHTGNLITTTIHSDTLMQTDTVQVTGNNFTKIEKHISRASLFSKTLSKPDDIFDGYEWIVEGIKDEKYVLIYTHCPDETDKEIYKLGTELLTLRNPG